MGRYDMAFLRSDSLRQSSITYKSDDWILTFSLSELFFGRRFGQGCNRAFPLHACKKTIIEKERNNDFRIMSADGGIGWIEQPDGVTTSSPRRSREAIGQACEAHVT